MLMHVFLTNQRAENIKTNVIVDFFLDSSSNTLPFFSVFEFYFLILCPSFNYKFHLHFREI